MMPNKRLVVSVPRTQRVPAADRTAGTTPRIANRSGKNVNVFRGPDLKTRLRRKCRGELLQPQRATRPRDSLSRVINEHYADKVKVKRSLISLGYYKQKCFAFCTEFPAMQFHRKSALNFKSDFAHEFRNT